MQFLVPWAAIAHEIGAPRHITARSTLIDLCGAPHNSTTSACVVSMPSNQAISTKSSSNVTAARPPSSPATAPSTSGFRCSTIPSLPRVRSIGSRTTRTKSSSKATATENANGRGTATLFQRHLDNLDAGAEDSIDDDHSTRAIANTSRALGHPVRIGVGHPREK